MADVKHNLVLQGHIRARARTETKDEWQGKRDPSRGDSGVDAGMVMLVPAEPSSRKDMRE